MTLTLIFLAIITVVILVYDVIIVLVKGGDATISWTLYAYGQKYPVVPFVIGFIFGHIFFVQNCHN